MPNAWLVASLLILTQVAPTRAATAEPVASCRAPRAGPATADLSARPAPREADAGAARRARPPEPPPEPGQPVDPEELVEPTPTPEGERALPTPDPEAPCCYTHPRYAGVCAVTPGEGETCATILAYLNDVNSAGKTYCRSTELRGEWEPTRCPAATAGRPRPAP